MMSPDQIATLPPAQFTLEVWRLHREALPDPDDPRVFNSLMRVASGLGMRYVEALQFVIERRGTVDEAAYASAHT